MGRHDTCEVCHSETPGTFYKDLDALVKRKGAELNDTRRICSVCMTFTCKKCNETDRQTETERQTEPTLVLSYVHILTIGASPHLLQHNTIATIQ